MGDGLFGRRNAATGEKDNLNLQKRIEGLIDSAAQWAEENARTYCNVLGRPDSLCALYQEGWGGSDL